MSTFVRLTPKLSFDILPCRMPIVANEEESASDDMQSHGGERTTLEGFLGGHEVWADYLRLAGISVWLIWTFVTRPDAVLLWAPMLATFALSLAGVVLTRKGLFPAWRRSVIVVLNVALLTYFVWAVGVQSTTLTVFYVVLVVAVTMVGSPAASRVAVASVVGMYSSVVLLQDAGIIPVAPLVRPQFRHALVAGGPVLPILSVVTAVIGAYVFVRLARARLESQAATEKALRLAHETAEKQTRALQRQLELSQRMEGLGRLAGGVAHDFNNVLTAIVSNVTLARDEMLPGSAAHRDLGEALLCASRAEGVVRQVLAFSHRNSGEATVVRPASVVTGAHNLLSRAVGNDISMEVHAEDDTPCVLIDPMRLEQILLNLAVNARDAMPGRGRIVIRVRREAINGAGSTWPDLGPGEYARIDFADDGAGMDEATLAQALLPFFTTKPKGKGTGIGLSIVFSIVRTSGGAVHLESAPGRGTTVSIMLPATEGVPAPVRPPVPQSVSGTGTILLVEDQDDVMRATLRLLKKRGYEVICARSGEEALEMAGRSQACIDLLLTDVVMPGMSGPVLAQRLRETRPGVQVLLMSGHPQDQLDLAGAIGESSRFLGKPFDPAELLECVAEAMRRGEHRFCA